MSSDNPTLNEIRAAMRHVIDTGESSLRAVARAVGMSPTGLSNLLDSGGQPRKKTMTRLREWWYARLPPDTGRAIDTHLAGMVASLPVEMRVHARRELLETLLRLHATLPRDGHEGAAGMAMLERLMATSEERTP